VRTFGVVFVLAVDQKVVPSYFAIPFNDRGEAHLPSSLIILMMLTRSAY
jgi:hypothetical protein